VNGRLGRVNAVTLAQLQEAGADYLPGLLGIVVDDFDDHTVRAHLALDKKHFAPNGYVHAATVVALADTAAGYGCLLTLPEDGVGFTTIELKSNFLGTARDGTLTCEARLVHGGRTTQVWDATVSARDGSPLALFRCTQMILR
jgi:1,4-dihydroxy-2-naphthoyl-CoA hydrolase